MEYSRHIVMSPVDVHAVLSVGEAGPEGFAGMRARVVTSRSKTLLMLAISSRIELSVDASWGGDAHRYAAAGDSASSSACCCSAVRLVRMTVPPNLAISGSTRSVLVLRAITKSPDPPG